MWLTFKAGGIVVLTMGFPGMTLDQCLEIKEIVIADTTSQVAVADAAGLEWDEWSVTCEPEKMDID